MTASQRMIQRVQTKVAVLEERFGQRVGQLEQGQEGVGQLQEWQHQVLVRRKRLIRALLMSLQIVCIVATSLFLHIKGYF